MKIIALTIIALFVLNCQVHAGQKKLLANAKKTLIAANDAVLKKIPKSKIPTNGYIRVKADVRGAGKVKDIKIKEIRTETKKVSKTKAKDELR